jgi:SulP family sulfate permease
MKRARNPDAVGLSLIAGLVERLQARGLHVLLAGVRPELHEGLERSGLLGRLRGDYVFLERAVRQTSTQEAMRLARQLCAAPARSLV